MPIYQTKHSKRSAKLTPSYIEDFAETSGCVQRYGRTGWEPIPTRSTLLGTKAAFYKAAYYDELIKTMVIEPKKLGLRIHTENPEISTLKKRVEELTLQIQEIQKTISGGPSYEDIDIQSDGLEAYLCEGRTYREKYPNMHLAIDAKNRKVLLSVSNEEEFISGLQEFSGIEDLLLIDTFNGVSR